MELRPYQKQAIQSTLDAISTGKSNKQVWVMATGTGKTVCFAKLASHTINKTGKKVLVLAHREELLEQAKDKILKTDPTLKVGIEMAGNHISMDGNNVQEFMNEMVDTNDHQANPDVIVASVPTLGREGSSRIKKFNPKDFGLIVVDEAHHASANSYVNVLKHFGVLKPQPINTALTDENQEVFKIDENADWNQECLLLGVTATPSRTDNKGINFIFDDVVFEYNIIQAIKEEYLSPIRAMRIRTEADLSSVGRTAGDFNLGELEEAVNTDERNQLIVKAYKEITPGKQALVFAVNIKHALALVETFMIAEISTSYVIGSTNKEDRVQRLKDFHDKKINVMVNVGVLTEGIDIPSVDAVFMTRPTQSGILYSQMLGRGTRLYPGKEYLMVVDFVDNTKRQRLQTVASLLGKPDAIDFQGKDILAVQSELEALQEVAPMIDLESLDITRIQALIEKAKYAIEEVDLLGAVRAALPLAQYSRYEWQAYGEDSYRLSIGANKETGMKQSFYINETLMEKFIVRKNIYDTTLKKSVETIEIGAYSDLETAVREADKYLEQHHAESLQIADSQARWKKDKFVTESQAEWLLRYNTPLDVVKKMTKGDASRALNMFFSNKSKRPTSKQTIEHLLELYKESVKV